MCVVARVGASCGVSDPGILVLGVLGIPILGVPGMLTFPGAAGSTNGGINDWSSPSLPIYCRPYVPGDWPCTLVMLPASVWALELEKLVETLLRWKGGFGGVKMLLSAANELVWEE